MLATATTVVISPHYPWYLGWLALFACFAPYSSVIYLSASGVLLYLDPYHREAIYPWVIYGHASSSPLGCGPGAPPRPPACLLRSHAHVGHAAEGPDAATSRRSRPGTCTASPPVCLYLETTNRCNLLCETCPRTFETLEPPQDMTWELFTSIVDQFPSIARVVLHGVGEPMLVKDLPRMIRYLKDRGIYVLFNTNGTLLNPKKFQELIDTGLDELRVSVDAADRKTYLAVRGKDFFDRIVRDVGKFTAFQAQVGSATPKVSIWLTGLKETVQQLPEFVRMAANMGVREVHLQRLVFDDAGFGMARAENSLFEQTQAEEEQAIAAAQAIGAQVGVMLDASGATEPGVSLKNQDGDTPWATCRRPWSLMYFTAHGRALPCCIAPFSARGYSNYTLGDATQQSLREIWNGDLYKDFRRNLLSDTPPKPCENCGLRWSL